MAAEDVIWFLWLLARVIIILISIRLCAYVVSFIIKRLYKVTIEVNGFKLMRVDEVILKTEDLDIVVGNVSLQLKWFNHNFSHFGRVHISNCQIQLMMTNRKESKVRNRFKKKIGIKLLKWIFKICDLNINKIDIEIQELDHKDKTSGYLHMLKLTEGLALSVLSLPNKLLALEYSVGKVNYSYYYLSNLEGTGLTLDDNLFLLCDVSAKALGSLTGSSNVIASAHCNIPAVDMVLYQGIAEHITRRRNTMLPSTSTAATPAVASELLNVADLLPQRIEVVLDKVDTKYLLDSDQRCLHVGSSKLAIDISNSYGETGLCASVQGLFVKSHHDICNINQFIAVVKLLSNSLSVQLTCNTLKAHLFDKILDFWRLHFIKLLPKPQQKSSTSYHLPVAIVTTIEISDWLINVDLGTTRRASLYQLVMANGHCKWGLSVKSTSLSLRASDVYVHVPGLDPATANDTSILPSMSVHCWGRVVAVGSIIVTTVTNDQGVSVRGNGRNIMAEWSDALQNTILYSIDYIKNNYLEGLSGIRDGRSDAPTKRWKLSLTLESVNGIVYITRPHLLSLIWRTDTVIIKDTLLSLYKTVVDELRDISLSSPITCVSVSNMPANSLADMSTLSLQYHTVQKEVRVAVGVVKMYWTAHGHLTVTNIIRRLLPAAGKGTAAIGTGAIGTGAIGTGVIGTGVIGTGAIGTGAAVKEGGSKRFDDVIVASLERLPVNVHFEVEEGTLMLELDNTSRVQLVLQTCHSSIQRDSLTLDMYQGGVEFDGHRILTVEGLLVKCPHDSSHGDGQVSNDGRGRFSILEWSGNAMIYFFASRMEIPFPCEYKFHATYEKFNSIRKFLTAYHSSGRRDNTAIEDNWLEVKLRANYERERERRNLALDEKIQSVKDKQGLAFSSKKVQSLYNSLEERNADIYCQRVKEIYNSEPLRTQLLTLDLQQTKLHLMSDPTMKGRCVVQQLEDIDDISPLNDGDYQFSTILGLYVLLTSRHLEVIQLHVWMLVSSGGRCKLRDYPWKLLEGENFDLSGRLVLAEQEAQDRECHSVPIRVGSPWQDGTVIRKITPLKYYHDFDIVADTIEWSWGPCLDPSFAQLNYSFNFLTKPTLDPSPIIPWWDKLRLLLHGKARLKTKSLKGNLLSSLDPYNTAEYMDIVINNMSAVLRDNRSLAIDGNPVVYLHMVSHYDECKLLDISSVHLELHYDFICRGPSHSHHSVVRCVPSKLPVISQGKVHDSYAMFRSSSMTVDVKFSIHNEGEQLPEILLYANSLRWLQQFFNVLRSHVSRPIKRGKVHSNVRPKKMRFTRQIQTISLSCQFTASNVVYWASVQQEQGLECHISGAVLTMQYHHNLMPYNDGLLRRPRAEWNIVNCTGTVSNLSIYSCVRVDAKIDDKTDPYIISNPSAEYEDISYVIEKRILLSIERLKYDRADKQGKAMEFMHVLKTDNTRFVWNEVNRDVVYKILDTYKLYKRLEHDLSTEALQSALSKMEIPPILDESAESSNSEGSYVRYATSGCAMLDQLLSDLCNGVVNSVEQREPSDPKLKGIAAASSDVKQYNWLIELRNTQAALYGVEEKGYVICTSYIAQVFGQEHEPQYREGDLVSKNSWAAKVQDLQYFCTTGSVCANYIPWLPLSIIQPPGLRDNKDMPLDEEDKTASLLRQLGPDLEHIGGGVSLLPGEAVGGQVQGVIDTGILCEDELGCQVSLPARPESVLLQRIASRCHCQVHYVTFGEVISPTECPHSPHLLSPTKESLTYNNEAVDTFTFRYPSADVCTTSMQYALIRDIITKLLLYEEPRKKVATEEHTKMKFMLQLATKSDIRKPILAKQNKIRQIISRRKSIEQQLYVESKSLHDSQEGLTNELFKTKEELSQASLELRAMIRAFKEKQIYTSPHPDSEVGNLEPVRRIEVWLDDARWSLMQEEQLKVAEVQLTNFSYNRMSFTDNSGEHRFELGSFRVRNCIPSTPEVYTNVLSPYDPADRHLRVDKNVSLRIFCRNQAPVAGISVTEHLEINVVPLAVTLTEKFYNMLQEFFLPKSEEREESEVDHSKIFGGNQPTYYHRDHADGGSFSRASASRRSMTSNISPPDSPSIKEGRKANKRGERKNIDDVEKMKARASNVKTFIYVKVPQTTLCITYKGESISVKEMHDHLITISTIEYHNVNMTWRSLLLQFKKDYKNAIIAQTLKSAIGIKQNEEKAGLASPKLGRSTSDILLGKIKEASKARGKKIFKKYDSKESLTEEEEVTGVREGSPLLYQPPSLTNTDSDKIIKLHGLHEQDK